MYKICDRCGSKETTTLKAGDKVIFTQAHQKGSGYWVIEIHRDSNTCRACKKQVDRLSWSKSESYGEYVGVNDTFKIAVMLASACNLKVEIFSKNPSSGSHIFVFIKNDT